MDGSISHDSINGLQTYLETSINKQINLQIADRFNIQGKLTSYDSEKITLSDVILSNSDSQMSFPTYTADRSLVTQYPPKYPNYPDNHRFQKITPVNGFDADVPDNAMQNNYAWSMAEMGDYIYVGTARNIPYTILSNEVLGNIPVPPILEPKNVDNAGEIWRYKKDGSEEWQRVYKAPPNPMNIGIRYMVLYKGALYAGALTPLSPDLLILKSTDGVNWMPLDSGIHGFSTRIMVEHNGFLFMGALPLIGAGEAQLFMSTDPEQGWEQVNLDGDPTKNPTGNIDLLLSFNNHLYVGTALPTGFELWRTQSEMPQTDNWVLVIDKGAGDARNEHPWAWDVFDNHIYIGTAIEVGILSINPDNRIVPPKGFDLIRVNRNDNWELIVGGPPVVPTKPITGNRGLPLSGYPSGFGDITNGYCWQIQAFEGQLYLGTWSWNNLIPPFISVIPEFISGLIPDSYPYSEQIRVFINAIISPQLIQSLYNLGWKYIGFDLWRSSDGVNWSPVSLNGLGNPYNYGVRKLFVSSEPRLFLGTANPFEGAEVWVKDITIA